MRLSAQQEREHILASVHVWLTFHPPSLSTRQGRRFVGIGDLLSGQLGDSGSLDLARPVTLGLYAVEACLLGEQLGKWQGEREEAAQAGWLCSTPDTRGL